MSLSRSLLRFAIPFFCVLLLSIALSANARDIAVENGEMRWQDTGEPVALFGVNYSAPFAYGYRAIERRGIDHKAAIDMDVAHIARLKLDAYRIHLWDKVISDKQGNLLNNHNLELFDYLMMRLQERGIKAIITPIAWWGSGYPEPDPEEPGFAVGFSKSDMNEKEHLIAAQERYLTQFLQHKNRYTNRVIGTDPDIIAFELFNEPKHPQPPEDAKAYVNRLINAVRAAGVTKPLFYNIAEQGNKPQFAEALCNSNIDGIAYQWYPTGLLKYSAMNTNMLPAVSRYTDPFAGIEACAPKARMVYEFDAADVAHTVMYPAMARSFKQAGFQWATQFAYDPAVIADTNSDYNTHFLNLLYTPGKAISLMIAGEEFRALPVDYQAADYPANNQFGHTHLSYQQNLAVFDDGKQFYYTNSTNTKPKQANTLEHIAGVGSSPLVSYTGSGAYFLDRLDNGDWRLEVFPDVINLQDAYQSSSLQREVSRLYVQHRDIQINLPDLGSRFTAVRIGGTEAEPIAQAEKAKNGRITVQPGIYVLSEKSGVKPDSTIDNRYFLPTIPTVEPVLIHQAARQHTLGDPLIFRVEAQGISNKAQVSLQLKYQGYNDYLAIPMTTAGQGVFEVSLPEDDAWQQPGKLEYVFTVNDSGKTITFPGKVSGSPQDWDHVTAGQYNTVLMPALSPVVIFDPAVDRAALITPQQAIAWPASSASADGESVRLEVFEPHHPLGGSLLRTELPKDLTIQGRDLTGYNALALRVRATTHKDILALGVIANDGLAYGASVTITDEWQTLVIPLAALKPVATVMPRAYPMFMPVTLPANNTAGALDLQQLSGLQFQLPVSRSNHHKHRRGIELGEVALVALSE